MDRVLQLAIGTIPASTANNKVFRKDGETDDIINVIKSDWTEAVQQAKAFATELFQMCKTESDTMFALYTLLVDNVKLSVDPLGVQWVKKPAAMIHSLPRVADCKSYSLFISSVLTNLRIPHIFRFVSFDPYNTNVQHVYIVAYPNTDKQTFLDVNLKNFNTQKTPYYNHINIDMTKIYSVGAIPAQATEPAQGNNLLGGRDFYKIGDAEMDLRIGKQRLEIERDIVAGIKGIGSLHVERYNDAISVASDAIGAIIAMENNNATHLAGDVLGNIADDAINGKYSIATQVAGIGSFDSRMFIRRNHIRRLNMARRNRRIGSLDDAAIGKFRFGKFLKNAANSVRKGVKAAGQTALKVGKGALAVVTLPMRLAAKAIVEVTLPKASPFFLYLFVQDPALIAKLPAAAQAKRRKADKIKNFICKGLGMKEKHFMGIVRNNIIKHYHKSPEAVIADLTKGIAGIGILPLLLIEPLMQIITKIISMFGGNKDDAGSVSANDAPATSDFGGMATQELQSLTSGIKQQPENTSALSTFTNDAPVTQTNTQPDMMNYTPTQSDVLTDKETPITPEGETEQADGASQDTQPSGEMIPNDGASQDTQPSGEMIPNDGAPASQEPIITDMNDDGGKHVTNWCK